ncbi:hypothetical protein PYCC9005_004547 [Savitreella phatthalungensis]
MSSLTPKQPGFFQRMLGKKVLAKPAEIFNMYLFIGCLTFGVLGAARGFDEGNVSNMLNSKNFKSTFGLVVNKTTTKAQVAAISGNISGMVQIASIGGSLFAFLFNDRVGRVWTLRGLCLLWIAGVVTQITSHSLGQLYAGRVLSGFGIGATTVTGPTYLVELADPSFRGLAVGVFSGSVYLGIALSYAATYGSTLHQTGRIQWQIPFTLQIMFAGISIILSFFAVESPRYYFLRNNEEQGIKNLLKIRQLPREHPYIVDEIDTIRAGIKAQRDAYAGQSLTKRALKIFSTPANRYRLIAIGFMSQALGQWSGANSITLYAPQYFSLLGITGQETKLFATLIFGIVKLIASIACAVFLVDRIGRKRSLYIGVTIQFLTMFYIATLTAAVPSLQTGKIESNGVRAASTIGIIGIYLNGAGWAMGFNSLQYVIAAEVWPLDLRALGNSIIMAAHFILQWSNSKAVPVALLTREEGGITPAGTFYLMATVCALALIYCYFFLPELAGHSLESMEAIFSGPWWKIGRQFARQDLRDRPAVLATDDNADENSLYDIKNEKPEVVMVEDSAVRKA